MGSPTNAPNQESDEVPTTVTTFINGLWMSRYEVSQQQYSSIMSNNPSWFSGDLTRPVEYVAWTDATNYCARFTAQERTAGRLPAGYVYRLPTEAEWENGCRAGTTSSYSYGEDTNGTELVFYGWFYDNSGSTNTPTGYAYIINGEYYTTQPAGTKQPNPWGLYDLYGSVWEWCQDWYGSYPGGSVTNYAGPASGTYRVVRGGSWNTGSDSCRSANRSCADPAVRSSGIGFRTVLAPGS